MVPEEDDPEVGDPASNFSLDLDSYNISVLPGEIASAILTISNHGLIENKYTVSVTGIPQSWIANPLGQVSVSPASQQTVTLTIRPPNSSESQAGRYRVNYEVANASDPGHSKNVILTLTVQAFKKFQSKVQPHQLSAGQDINIIIENLGNTQEVFDVFLEDLEDIFSFKPPRVKMSVPPGEIVSTQIKSTLRGPHWFGSESKHNVTAWFNSGGVTSQDHSLEIISKPVLSPWILLLPSVLCIVVGVFIVQALTTNSIANVYEAIAQELRFSLSSETPEAILISYTPPPTDTPTSTLTPSPTITPTSTISPTPTISPTSVPDALVIVDEIPVWTGPGEEYYQENNLLSGEMLEVTGQFDTCNWLKITSGGGIEGWISGATGDVRLNIECADIPPGTYRPRNGTLIFSDFDLDGLGELVVENGTSRDGLIILVDSSTRPLLAFYVRSDKEYNMKGVPDGDYEIYFSQGEGWNGEEKQFTKRINHQQFEDKFNFTTTGNLYRIWTITLHPVPEGTAKINLVDPEEFPDLNDLP